MLLVIVALAAVLMMNLVGKSLPPMQLQPFSVMLGILFVLFFILLVVFASQPAIGMIIRADAFLAAPIVEPYMTKERKDK